jgi:hypothetical protein
MLYLTPDWTAWWDQVNGFCGIQLSGGSREWQVLLSLQADAAFETKGRKQELENFSIRVAFLRSPRVRMNKTCKRQMKCGAVRLEERAVTQERLPHDFGLRDF